MPRALSLRRIRLPSIIRASRPASLGRPRPVLPRRAWQTRAIQTDGRGSYSSAMESGLVDHLTSSRLAEVRQLWFEHLQGPDSFVLPSQDEMRRWFNSGDLDRACIERFSPTLEAIRRSGVKSGTELIKAARPAEASDWLGLVILLDQVPRNCYRGDAAAVVFNHFDPMAREVALAAMERGIPETPQMRWNLAYRHWFYLPLMHSEDLALQDKATWAYERLRRDVYALAHGGADPAQRDGQDRHRAHAAAVVRATPDKARRLADMFLEFEERHRAVIKRFGRFPHQNKAMAREATVEEKEFLESGGDTFAA